MPIQVQTSITVENQQKVTAEREIENILILTSSNVYWEVWTRYSGKCYKKEFYSMPIADFISINTSGKSFAEDIETTLWAKAALIDAMPENTPETIRLKRQSYGILFTYHINR